MENRMKVLCIYHGHCDDGFAAAWAVRHALGDQVEFHLGQYGHEPPDPAGRDVVLVDFSYKREVLDRLAQKARTVLILDHHKTAAEDLAGFPAPPTGPYNPDGMSSFAGEMGWPVAAYCLFDMNRSGAGMAWDFFHPGQLRPAFINYVEDRDLWRKALPDGDEFTIALRSYPQDFDIWDKLVDSGPPDLIRDGRHIQRYYRARVEELKRGAYRSEIIYQSADAFATNAICMAVNAPYFAASEVAGEMCDTPGVEFGLCYFEGAGGEFYYSLRSRGDFDVSQIAKSFGGGGHKNAAGFKSKTPVHRRVIADAA
jgi:oligoribonuclease NrnB/cAMP/cGMP phosphodiesterase (DHH superfamily)